VLLKDAIKPNLVQTLEHTPVLIHGGPFANIAHGCNSVIATKMALKLADYVVTEAGFGADLGAEKFLNIKCRGADLKPDAVVIVATLKALKYHGGVEKENIKKENLEALKKGIHNLLKHIDNIKNKFGLNVIVAINKYVDDSLKEILLLKNKLEEQGINLSLVEAWEKGGIGAEDLARKVIELTKNPTTLNFTYKIEDSIKTKIEKIAENIYGAEGVEYSNEAEAEIAKIEELGYGKLPVCIAKTQYSFSDDPKNLICDEPFKIHVKEVCLKSGSEFVVVLTGKIFTMPGLPRVPAAENIDIDENGNIVGIF
jgi:formate--tetrahydrofolate ligase